MEKVTEFSTYGFVAFVKGNPNLALEQNESGGYRISNDPRKFIIVENRKQLEKICDEFNKARFFSFYSQKVKFDIRAVKFTTIIEKGPEDIIIEKDTTYEKEKAK